MNLPSKVNDPKQTKHKKIYQTVNELIDYISFAEQCCTCNGCPRHDKKWPTTVSDEHLVEAGVVPSKEWLDKSPKTFKNTPREWETRFDYLTGNLIKQETLLDVEELKSFIRTLITTAKEKERTRVLRIVEEQRTKLTAMSKTNSDSIQQTKGYNQALSDLKERLKDAQ